MSVRVMTAVWDITLCDSEKIVLLALADCANDEGWCWPSMATLAKKCSKTDRTVQHAIRDLVAAGHLTRIERPGKGCRYQVHPRNGFTPEETSPPKPVRTPPKRLRDTPEAASDKPSKNHKYPSRGDAPARASTAPDLKNERGKKGIERGTRLADDWAPPGIDDLPPMARTLVEQWPVGAYQAVCETFRLHWQSETRAIGCKRDWDAALAKWLISDHAKIMRDAKAGVSFAGLVPSPVAASSTEPPPVAVAAKGREDARSAAIRGVLRGTVGAATFDTWFAPVALIYDAPGLVVVTGSEFTRGWIEQNFKTAIDKAARNVIGAGVKWVRFEVESNRERVSA
tara:strand:+ start:224 stop:1246 length:1023 start_codon:yes stop_codon:yes gene_type:complete